MYFFRLMFSALILVHSVAGTDAATVISKNNYLLENTVVFSLPDTNQSLPNRLTAAVFKDGKFVKLPINWQKNVQATITSPTPAAQLSPAMKQLAISKLENQSQISKIFYSSALDSTGGFQHLDQQPHSSTALLVVVYSNGSVSQYKVTETNSQIILTAESYFSTIDLSQLLKTAIIEPSSESITIKPSLFSYTEKDKVRRSVLTLSIDDGITTLHSTPLEKSATHTSWHLAMNLNNHAQAVITKTVIGEPMLFLSNGYSATQNNDMAQLRMINPNTGELIRTLVLPTALKINNGLLGISAVDVNQNGSADFIAAGDWQGNLWLIDIRSTDIKQWAPLHNKVFFTACSEHNCTALNRLPIIQTPQAVLNKLGADFSVIFSAGKSSNEQSHLYSIAVNLDGSDIPKKNNLFHLTATSTSGNTLSSETLVQHNELIQLQLASGWLLALPSSYRFSSAPLLRQGLLHAAVTYSESTNKQNQAMLLSVFQDDGSQFNAEADHEFTIKAQSITGIQAYTLADQSELLVMSGEPLSKQKNELCASVAVSCLSHQPPNGRLAWQRLFR